MKDPARGTSTIRNEPFREMSKKKELRFETALSGLTIGAIATPRDQLETCRADELVSRVRKRASRFTEDYDHLPVEDETGFVGFFGLESGSSGLVATADGFRPLTTADLVGPDRPILGALLSREHLLAPRLVGSGTDVVGLLTPEDYSKPPAVQVLSSLLLELETEMTERIQGQPPETWLPYCGDPDEVRKRHADAAGALPLVAYSTFGDKLRILELWPRARRYAHPLSDLRDALSQFMGSQHYRPSDIRDRAARILDLLRFLIVGYPSASAVHWRGFVYYVNLPPQQRSLEAARQRAIRHSDPAGERRKSTWRLWCSSYAWLSRAAVLDAYAGLGGWMAKLPPLQSRDSEAERGAGGEDAADTPVSARVIRLPGEGELAWRAFAVYLGLPGANRSVPEARRRAILAADPAGGRSVSTWKNWAAQFNWRPRVRLYDVNSGPG